MTTNSKGHTRIDSNNNSFRLFYYFPTRANNKFPADFQRPKVLLPVGSPIFIIQIFNYYQDITSIQTKVYQIMYSISQLLNQFREGFIIWIISTYYGPIIYLIINNTITTQFV